MKLGIFGRNKTETVDGLLKSDSCKKKIEQFCNEDLPRVRGILIIFEDDKKEVYFKHAGFDPAQAILAADQVHHRIQHEGLKEYD